MNKKMGSILLCCVLSFFLIGCVKHNEDNLSKEIEQNKNEITRYVIMKDEIGFEYKIYYYGIDSAYITVDDNTYDFEQAILTGTLTLDDIFSEMEIYAELNDGGTKLYRNGDSRKYFNDSYSIVRCNTVDGNKDIYIGNSDMKYENGFCKFKTSDADKKLQDEVDKMSSTMKIIVKDTYDNDIENTIIDKEEIDNIIYMISRSTESTLPVTSEGTNLVVQMFNGDDKLITSIYVWKNGYFGFKYNKEYFISDEDLNSFKKILKI